MPLDPVDITFFDEELDEDGMVTYGSWSDDSGELRMNEYRLYSPDLALTTVHEVRHAAQHEFAGDLTLEDLQQYQRDAGVPVSEER